MALLFSSLQHCRSNSVFMLTFIMHMQFLICFLISLNISLIFTHKKSGEKKKDERKKNGREKRGRKLGKGEVEREAVWLLPTYVFQPSKKLQPNIFPCLHVLPLQNITIPHVARSAQLPCPAPALEATSSPSQQTQDSRLQTLLRRNSPSATWRISRILGYVPKNHQTQLKEVD